MQFGAKTYESSPILALSPWNSFLGILFGIFCLDLACIMHLLFSSEFAWKIQYGLEFWLDFCLASTIPFLLQFMFDNSFSSSAIRLYSFRPWNFIFGHLSWFLGNQQVSKFNISKSRSSASLALVNQLCGITFHNSEF